MLTLLYHYITEYKDEAQFEKETRIEQTTAASLSTLADNWRIYEDSHTYTSRVYQSYDLVNDLWIDLNDDSISQTISDSYRNSVNVQLAYNFTFYGHFIGNVVIATGGFLYVSDFMHKQISATQYIAPLMANFDPTVGGNRSLILYKGLESMFVVEWRDIFLSENTDMPFRFQCILYTNGTIVFLYQKAPIQVYEISTTNHPVKVGLSDAYYVVSNISGTQRTTIYEYHRIALNQSLVQDGNIIVITPLPTCNMVTDCETCVTFATSFKCAWCSSINRCSDGMDRHRQEWLEQCANNMSVSETCVSSSKSASVHTERSVTALQDTELPIVFNITTEQFASTLKGTTSAGVSNVTTERSTPTLLEITSTGQHYDISQRKSSTGRNNGTTNSYMGETIIYFINSVTIICIFACNVISR